MERPHSSRSWFARNGDDWPASCRGAEHPDVVDIIQCQREGTGADPRGEDTAAKHQEELSCDEFATTFLLEHVDAYAQRAAEPAALVRQKRQLGIYFGLFALTMLAKDNWGASESHPSVQTRINAVRELIAPQKSELAAGIAHVAFAVLGSVWRGTPNPY